MSAVESSIVLFPRVTTLAGTASFATAPLDVSRFGGAQLQIAWAEQIGATASATVHLEESLDGMAWPPEAASSFDLVGNDATRFLSIGFRLRWFRMRVENRCKFLTLWCEGILRGGGGGAQLWTPRGAAGAVEAAGGDTLQGTAAALQGRAMQSELARQFASAEERAVSKAFGGT